MIEMSDLRGWCPAYGVRPMVGWVASARPGDGLSMGGVVQLVLHDLEEPGGLFGRRVVVDAGGVQVDHLAVEDFFAAADVADALQQLPPVAAAAQLLQLGVVHGDAFDQILTQPGGGPDAELGGDTALGPVADGDDEVEVVGRQLAGDLPATLGANLSGIPTGCAVVQLTLVVDIADMFDTVGTRCLEQLGNLLLGEPDGFVFHTNLDGRAAVVTSVEDHLTRGLVAHSLPFSLGENGPLGRSAEKSGMVWRVIPAMSTPLSCRNWWIDDTLTSGWSRRRDNSAATLGVVQR